MLTMETPPRRSGHGKGCLILAGLVTLLILLPTWWWVSSQETPVVKIPQPAMPTPNAFLTFNAATDQMLDSGKVGYAISTQHNTGVKEDREYTWDEKAK